MNENRISENDMFKNETIEKLIDTKDIIKSHLDVSQSSKYEFL